MSLDGSDQRRIAANPAQDWAPVFSPDGRSIAFATDRDGNHEIHRMALDGGNPANDPPTPYTRAVAKAATKANEV